MISNELQVNINKNATIEPALLDKYNNHLRWADAVSLLSASASWYEIENAEAYGQFTVNPDGTALFKPLHVGSFSVICLIEYIDHFTGDNKELTQTLSITVKDKFCECEPHISIKPGNRIKLENDGLYVPELQVSLSFIYAEAKDEELPIPPVNQTTEQNLTKFAQDVGEDIKEIKEELRKLQDYTCVAGQTISALRVVYELNNTVRLLDYRDGDNIEFLLGITISAANAGSMIKVKRNGTIEDSGWNWTTGRIYLGQDGYLTQTPAETGYDVLIGVAVSPTKIIIKIQDPIYLD